MSNALDELFNGTLQPAFAQQLQQPKPSMKLDAGDELKELPVEILRDFPPEKHPFKPYTAERLEALRQDIIERGIIQPLIVRPIGEFQYEIVSGHNRRTAAREAGYTVLPCVVRQLTDDEALLQMLSTNLQQRQDLLPSEKAFAYRMQMETLKHQGARTDLTSSQSGTRLRADEMMAEQAGESRNQIQRYIRLTNLIPALLDRVDDKQIGFTTGETLSYLVRESQQLVDNFFFGDRKLCVDQHTADRLRELENADVLTVEKLESEFLSPPVKPLKKVSVSMKPIRHWFSPTATEKEVQDTIVAALKLYFESHQ